MKTTLLLGAILVGAAMMQMPSTPPVKMGLWESTVNTTVKLPPGAPNFLGGGPRTTVMHVCFTPDSWAKGVGPQQDQKSCVRSNEVYNPTGFSFDISCSKGKKTSHYETTFDNPAAIHGTVHTDSGPQGITIDSTTTSRFISSDCGAVTPDKPVVVH